MGAVQQSAGPERGLARAKSEARPDTIIILTVKQAAPMDHVCSLHKGLRSPRIPFRDGRAFQWWEEDGAEQPEAQRIINASLSCSAPLEPLGDDEEQQQPLPSPSPGSRPN